MPWNYRILAHKHADDVHMMIHEVYYDKPDGIPMRYTKDPVTIGGEDLTAMDTTLRRMLSSLSKPVLWAGDRFPEEYNQNE